jgi:hypothetical protein
MEPERIDLVLATRAGRVTSARLRSTRQAAVTGRLRGRPLARSLEAVPILFPLCARAQQVAAIEAVEHGSGLTVSVAHREARRALVRAEAIEGHARSLWLEGAQRLDGVCAIERYAALRHAVSRLACALYPEGDVGRVGGGHLRPVTEALPAVLATIHAELAPDRLPDGLGTRDDLLAWADTDGGVAARLVRTLARRGWTALVPALRLGAALDDADLGHRLGSSSTFAAAPELDDGPREVGALARQASHPLVRDVIEHDGPGLLARLVARLVELSVWPATLAEQLGLLSPTPPGTEPIPDRGEGLAQTETARGPLAHRIAWEQGKVQDWDRVAPTEWTFHPGGVATRGCLGWPDDEAQQRAEWALWVLDPCVPFGVEVHPEP